MARAFLVASATEDQTYSISGQRENTDGDFGSGWRAGGNGGCLSWGGPGCQFMAGETGQAVVILKHRLSSIRGQE